MLITEKYPEYKKEWKWGIKLRNISIFAIIMFLLSLLVGGIVLINTKSLYHLISFLLIFFGIIFNVFADSHGSAVAGTTLTKIRSGTFVVYFMMELYFTRVNF